MTPYSDPRFDRAMKVIATCDRALKSKSTSDQRKKARAAIAQLRGFLAQPAFKR